MLLIKHGKLKWAWVTGIPLAWDAAVTLTASYQKVFSDNPKLGFFAQRDKFNDAIDAGKVLAARQVDGRHARRGHELDGRRRAGGVLCDPDHHRDRSTPPASAIKAIRAGGLPTTEVPAVRVAAARALRAVRARPRRSSRRGARDRRRELARGVRWYLREVSGESAYDRYVEHRRREHPGEPVMARRDFERRRQDAREARPQARCC